MQVIYEIHLEGKRILKTKDKNVYDEMVKAYQEKGIAFKATEKKLYEEVNSHTGEQLNG